MKLISSFGKIDSAYHDVSELTHSESISQQIINSNPGIAYGMGRSYGDICLNPQGTLWHTTRLDRLIHFDANSGRLICEAGVLLQTIQQLFIPRGWMLPVTPGTQLVTIGGAVANDVHGKNHHSAASFGNHIKSLELVRTDGTVLECSPSLLSAWFYATIGGLGLTGIISKVDIQLKKVKSPWLDTESIPFNNLHQFFQIADESQNSWEYTVSWIDCLAKKACKGIFLRANSHLHAIESQRKMNPRMLSVPIRPPMSLINTFTLKSFNSLYFNLKKNQGKKIVHYEPFFYPLDKIKNWNRIYGPKGFYQYQSVIPRAVGHEALQAMLAEISESGLGSFLAVLKTFGTIESKGLLSFPREGVTLALDFPNQGSKTHHLFERLDAIVAEAGGRIYPAKDARMPKSLFVSGYPNLLEFLNYRDSGISSALSRRLMDDN